MSKRLLGQIFEVTVVKPKDINAKIRITDIQLVEDIATAAISAVRNAKSDRYARLAYYGLINNYMPASAVEREYSSEIGITRALSKQHQIVWC